MALRVALFLSLSILVSLLVAPTAPAATQLVATVGPGFTIGFETADGQAVKHLDPGQYTITVHDRSSSHNFHVFGPGVDRHTEVSFVGDATWEVTLKDGTYNFVCDPHSTSLRGSFTVGTPPDSNPTPKPAAGKKLVATVGPSQKITVTRGGVKVKSLRAGSYTVVVNDRSDFHNFHLIGPGVNKRTTVAFKGTKTWKLQLKKGLYRFQCDPHKGAMKGSFRVT